MNEKIFINARRRKTNKPMTFEFSFIPEKIVIGSIETNEYGKLNVYRNNYDESFGSIIIDGEEIELIRFVDGGKS